MTGIGHQLLANAFIASPRQRGQSRHRTMPVVGGSDPQFHPQR
jgi:hypothetical protein